jgi:hypothetical protein
MRVRLLNVGFGNVVVASRIIAIVSPGSAPMKRMKEEAREKGKLIDATYGRKTRAVVVTDSDHVILSAINPETAALRLLGKKVADHDDPDEAEESGDSTEENPKKEVNTLKSPPEVDP